jgi:proteasome lid subunit RPN8/RPN11
MIRQAIQELPNECCGLLAGRVVTDATGEAVGLVEARFPLVNELASPAEFFSEPRSMFEAMRAMRERRLDTLAVYHSHPSTEAVPSSKDRARSYDPGVMSLIVSLQAEQPHVQAWWLRENEHEQGQWELVEDGDNRT